MEIDVEPYVASPRIGLSFSACRWFAIIGKFGFSIALH